MTTIVQEANMSLTDYLIPSYIHVKQYDNLTRRIKCVVYNGGVLEGIDSDSSVEVSCTLPSGNALVYTSEDNSDILYISDGCIYFVIPSAMTAEVGRVPVDVTLTDGDTARLGLFSLVLSVSPTSKE